jgi:hypothetical protein
MQDSDAEATVLEALAAHHAGVEEGYAICEAEKETWTDEDISGDDETSEEEELSGTEDKKPKGCEGEVEGAGKGAGKGAGEGEGEGEGNGGGAGGGAKDEVCLTVLLSESAIITPQQVLPSQETLPSQYILPHRPIDHHRLSCDGCGEAMVGEDVLQEHQMKCVQYQVKIAVAAERKKMSGVIETMKGEIDVLRGQIDALVGRISEMRLSLAAHRNETLSREKKVCASLYTYKDSRP